MKTVSIFLIVFLVIGFLFLALPKNGYAGVAFQLPGCCQFLDGLQPDGCSPIVNEMQITQCTNLGGELHSGSSCVVNPGQLGTCSSLGFNMKSSVPTLSEWGLIVLAGVLGLIAFVVIRRKKATA